MLNDRVMRLGGLLLPSGTLTSSASCSALSLLAILYIANSSSSPLKLAHAARWPVVHERLLSSVSTDADIARLSPTRLRDSVGPSPPSRGRGIFWPVDDFNASSLLFWSREESSGLELFTCFCSVSVHKSEKNYQANGCVTRRSWWEK